MQKPPALLERYPPLSLLASSALFAVMATCVKILSGAPGAGRWAGHDLPSLQLVFFRSLLPTLFLLPVVARSVSEQSALVRNAAPGLLLRGLAGGLSMICYFLAIDRISLAGAVMTAYTSPIWAALLGAWVLKEPTPRRLFLAFPVAYLGVVLVAGAEIQDRSGLAGYGLGMASAALAGLAYATVRSLRGIRSEVIVMALSLAGTLGTLPFLPGNYQAPTGLEWALILTMGVSATAAQVLMTIGYRYNSAARASTLNMATVGFTTLAAWLVVGEPMHANRALGLALLATGTLLATSLKKE